MPPSIRIPKSPLARYALALTASLIAAGLHWTTQPFVGARIPFLFYLPTILLIAASLGRGPAWLVLFAGLFNGGALLSYGDLAALSSAQTLLAMLAYLVIGSMLAGYGGRLQLVTRQKAEFEQRLALVQASTRVGLYEVNLDTGTVLGSPAFWTLLGTTPKVNPVPMDEWISRLHADDAASARSSFYGVTADHAADIEREDRILLPDGQTRWVLSRVALDINENGNATRLRGAMADISDRKRTQALLEVTQKELVQQLDDLHRLHELSMRLVQVSDVDIQIQLVLQSLVDFHGAHQGLISLYDAERDQVQVRASIGFRSEALAQLQESRAEHSTCKRVCAERQRVIVANIAIDSGFAEFRDFAMQHGFKAVHSTPMLTQTGDIIGALSIHLDEARAPTQREICLADICARKAAVALENQTTRLAAETSDRRLKVALESAAVPFSILQPVRDADGKVVDFRWNYLNPAAVKILGQSLDQLLGKRIQDVIPKIWEQPNLLANYTAVAERGEVREFEFYYPRRDGIEGWFHVVASPMQGAVAAWYADVSERKFQEQLLRDADQRKDEFLATLAHELRNPLAPIRQAALISKTPHATDAQKRWSHEVIERQVQHMALLLDDLLDVSRITHGHLELRKRRTDITSIIDSAVETARPLIDAKQHALTVELPTEPIRFEADALRVAQIVSNLLTNAAKYTPAGGAIRLLVERDGPYLMIKVTDNGIGLNADELPSIFKMFAQVKGVHDWSEGGLGIGLALAKGLVELHGGWITAHSAGQNKGSEFKVCLPIELVSASSGQVLATPVITPVASRKILVADDNKDTAVSLAILLEMNGHHVKIAHDGEEAVALYKDFHPDLALLDIGMPKLTGYEAAKEIRRDPHGETVTLVAVTGWGQESDKQQALEAGFNHHITKPLDPEQLNTLLSA